MKALGRRQLGRTDRHVRRGRMTLSAGAPQRRLAFMAEEALRLCTLPGEEHGRVYNFRRLHVQNLPVDGDRKAWLDAFQHALEAQAAAAVHGMHPQAHLAEAVFFRSEQERSECLIRRLARGMAPTAWFWRQIIGSPSQLSTSALAERVIESLLQTSASWSAVAAGLLGAIPPAELVAFLKMLPDRAIRQWLEELGSEDDTYLPSIRLSENTRSLVATVTEAFGLDEPRCLWIASLEVIARQPSAVETHSAVAIARSALRAIPTLAEADDRSVTKIGVLDDVHQSEQERTNLKEFATPAQETRRHSDGSRAFESDVPTPPICYGESTAGAGLFFLLNALRILRANTQVFSLLFLARLFEHLSDHVEIEQDDPIRFWARDIQAQSEPEEIDPRQVRIWSWKLRRWCWRAGHISVREIIRRPGFVTLAPTNLDVTLSIDSVDIRIRRMGLDLDPGWVPWFGRVVHFHYRFRGEPLG